MPTPYFPQTGIFREVGTLVRGSGLTSCPTYLHLQTPAEEKGWQARKGLWAPGAPCAVGFSPPCLLLSYGAERGRHCYFPKPQKGDSTPICLSHRTVVLAEMKHLKCYKSCSTP